MGISHYQVNLEVKGLVHIGNGKEYGKKDYFLSKDSKSVCVLDPAKFIEQLNAEQLTEYCAFLEDKRSFDGLEEWLEAKELRTAAKKAQAYQVNTELSKAKRGARQQAAVKEFVKDPYGKPYIPGSSFKGALRTALFAVIVANDRDDFKSSYPSENGDMQRDWQKKKNADNRLDKEAFWQEQPDPTDQKTIQDFMRYVSVSDSEPLSTDDLVFAKKYDKFSKNDEALHKRKMGNQSIGSITEGNELNIYRECIRPGTVITLQVDVDDRINDYLSFSLDAEGIAHTFQDFYERYEECFLSHFDIPDANDEDSGNVATADTRCQYVYLSGPFEGQRCRNTAVGNSGYCNSHQDKAPQQNSDAATENAKETGNSICFLGGGVDFDSKTILNELFVNEEKRLSEISHILYAQFPTKIDPDSKQKALWDMVKRAGFEPKPFKSIYRKGRLSKAKEDHRHWQDQDLGVSPHTLKFGVVNDKCYLMGKCELSIAEL